MLKQLENQTEQDNANSHKAESLPDSYVYILHVDVEMISGNVGQLAKI